MNDRIEWLDIAKGITIILVIIGHSSIPYYMSNFIWSFHMPLFFIASGWATNWHKFSFTKFVVSRTKSLLIPFLLYSFIVLILCNLYDIMDDNVANFKLWICKGWRTYALWFVPVLYISSIMTKFLLCCNNVTITNVLVFVMLFIGYYFSSFNVYLPWALSTIPYATFCIFLGCKLKRFGSIIDSGNYGNLIILICVTLLISSSWRLDMCLNKIIPIIPLTIGALSGTFMIFILSSLCNKYTTLVSDILKVIGKETFLIIAFSQMIILMVNKYIVVSAMIKYLLLTIILILLAYIKKYIVRLFYYIFEK